MSTKTTYLAPAGTTESGRLHRLWNAVRGIAHEMNNGTERMIERQAPWWR
jgi:hypothetical protein